MENNAELLRRARRKRQLRRQADNEQARPEPVESHAPAHVSRHASYTALMRSHDRMRSRHTGGQS